MSGFGDDISYPEVSRRYIPKIRKNIDKILDLETDYQPFKLSKGFTGGDLDVFWGVTGDGTNYAFAGGNEAEEEVIEVYQQLYSKMADNPSEQDVRQFLSYSEEIADNQLDLTHSGLITVQDNFSTENLELQVYVKRDDSSVDFATTSTGNQSEKVQEDNIAREAGKESFDEFLDKLIYDVEKEISYWNHSDMNADLESHGFQSIGEGEVPERVNPHERYRDAKADVWQLPASQTGLETSTGFLKIWDLNDRDGMVAGSTSELKPVESYGEAVKILNKGQVE